MSDDRERALMEAHCITASDSYFSARPTIYTKNDRKRFEEGFDFGWTIGRVINKPLSPEKTEVKPLEVIATRCEFPNCADYDFDYYDKRTPMPEYWHSVRPQEVMQLVALTDVQALLAKKEQEIEALRSALNAMLTHMGMDEDEYNKPTFDQARNALLLKEY